MARGAEAKLRRRNQKKEQRAKAEDILSGNTHDFGLPEEEEEELPVPQSSDSGPPVEEDTSADDDDDDVPPPTTKKAGKAMKKRSKEKAAAAAAAAQQKQGIKTMPLVLLVLLTGTTVIPALLFAGDWLGNFVQKHHVIGNLGYKLGIGASPKKRVLSFYEKHDPSKIQDVPKILSKHYGDYPLLIKKLERKYQDYGYFLGWEQDEAPLTVAIEQLLVTRDEIVNKFYQHAPQPIKTAATNVKYNLSFLYRRGRRIWRKHVWPVLEPIFGVPKGGAAQKRKDAREARERQASSKKTRRKSTEFRDDVEDEY